MFQTFTKQLSSLTPDSTIAIQALSDDFRIAHCFSRKKLSTQKGTSYQSNVPILELQEWFPSVQCEQDNSESTRTAYIFCRQATIEKLENAEHLKEIDIYEDLFVKAWTEGRKKRRAIGRIANKRYDCSVAKEGL